MPTFSAGLGITRFEDEATHPNGFMVRICRNGNKVSEFYSDKKYGGKRKAKLAAQERYQQLLDELGPLNPHRSKNLLTNRNTTGKVGVHVATTVDTRWSGGQYHSYCASWTTSDGQRKKISFSWKVHGQEAAFELACLARDLEINDRATILKRYAAKQARKGKAPAKTASSSARSSKSQPAQVRSAKGQSTKVRSTSSTPKATAKRRAK